MKVGAFVTSLLTLVVSAVLSVVLFNMTGSTPREGVEALSLIVTIPVFIILYALLASVLVMGTIASIKAITSDVKVIRVISILTLIFFAVMITLNVLYVLNLTAGKIPV